MPIRYNISSELNIVIYVCRGDFTAVDLFKASDLAFFDRRRKPGMISIYDLLFATENIELEDMYEGVQRLERAAEPGSGVGPRVLLTRSKGIYLIIEAMKLLPSKVPIQIDAYHSIEDAITGLGLVDLRQEVIRFWQECNSYYENGEA